MKKEEKEVIQGFLNGLGLGFIIALLVCPYSNYLNCKSKSTYEKINIGDDIDFDGNSGYNCSKYFEDCYFHEKNRKEVK